MEEWRIIVIDGEAWNYEVSSLGRVRNKKKCRLMKQQKNEDGYLKVKLSNKNNQKHFWVHRLVAIMFIPNPENKPEVNHLDENKTNNCVENLEWVTHKENVNHGTGNKRRSESHKGKQVSEETRCKLRDREVSEETRQKISEIHKGKTVSKETKRKISEAQKKRWSKRKSIVPQE